MAILLARPLFLLAWLRQLRFSLLRVIYRGRGGKADAVAEEGGCVGVGEMRWRDGGGGKVLTVAVEDRGG